MKFSGVDTEKLRVQQIREPGQRMPVGAVIRGQSPFQCSSSESGFQDRIFINILIVIVGNKTEQKSSGIDDDSDCREGNADSVNDMRGIRRWWAFVSGRVRAYF